MATGRLLSLRLIPMAIRRFQTIHARPEERQWLLAVLNREGRALGTEFLLAEDGSLLLKGK